MPLDSSDDLIGGTGALVSADWSTDLCRVGAARALVSCRVSRRLGVYGGAMADVMELPRARINASMIAQFIDRPVCFVGRLEKIHPTGKMFILSDGEGKNGTIELMEPLNQEISGVIEVVGKVTTKATILCASYFQFKEDSTHFDLELYNEAVKIINEHPQCYPLGLLQHE